MSNPRFSYNGKTIDLDCDVGGLDPEIVLPAIHLMAVDGTHQTIKQPCVNEIVRLSHGGFPLGDSAAETLRRKLEQWWSAHLDYPWTFARDASKMVSTELTLAKAAGSSVIVLTSTTGLVAGDQCVIRSRARREVVKILSVDSGTQVTLTETLNAGYASGARFRHQHFWQGTVLEGTADPIRNDSNTSWRFDLTFIEDVNGINA